jgi:hypothetical protein
MEKSLILITQKRLELTQPKTILLASIFVISVGLNAQVCTGSLGDAIATIDFGAGPNPGGGINNVPSTSQFNFFLF